METSEALKIAFVLELEKLSRKYRVKIGGCGCCDSPFLVEMEDKELDEQAGYFWGGRGDVGENLSWTFPGEWEWEKDHGKVIKATSDRTQRECD